MSLHHPARCSIVTIAAVTIAAAIPMSSAATRTPLHNDETPDELLLLLMSCTHVRPPPPTTTMLRSHAYAKSHTAQQCDAGRDMNASAHHRSCTPYRAHDIETERAYSATCTRNAHSYPTQSSSSTPDAPPPCSRARPAHRPPITTTSHMYPSSRLPHHTIATKCCNDPDRMPISSPPRYQSIASHHDDERARGEKRRNRTCQP